jgi:polyisoprenyl-phosphate glycosyltransferase
MPVYVCLMLAGGGVILAAVLAITSGAMAGLLVFLWAVLMAAVAVVGVYVIRIYKDVRGRPPFIVASRVGFE